MIKALFFSVVFSFSHIMYTQNIPDSLVQKSKNELIGSFNKAPVFAEKEIYGKTLIEKARSENDTLYLVAGYHMMALLYKDEKVLKYCDSIIAHTKTPDILYPASAYFIKGNFYYNKRVFQEALDNFLSASTYAESNYNASLVFKSNYAIGILKDRIGESEAALPLHRKNFAYAKKNIEKIGETDYLLSIFALASTFTDLKNMDSATFYDRYGIRESLRLNKHQEYHHFVLGSGVTNYYKKDYLKALDSLKKGLPYFEKIDNKPNMAAGYYYLGKVYFELDNEEKAVLYLKKVDTVFQQTKDVLPKIRESYELLKKHYKEKNEPEAQLYYVEQLLKLDSILYNNELYLSKKITKDYDIPRLTAEKEAIIKTLSQKEARARRTTIMVSVVLMIAIVLLYYQYRKIKLYKKRAEALIHNLPTELPVKENKVQKEDIGIAEDIVNKILSDLDTFEKSTDYLDTGITIHNVAKAMQTNANYLSRVVNYYKNVSFTHYINRLRVMYAINALKTNSMYRRFTISAIADEFGFNTGDSFSRAFYKYTGTRPSYFLKELKAS